MHKKGEVHILAAIIISFLAVGAVVGVVSGGFYVVNKSRSSNTIAIAKNEPVATTTDQESLSTETTTNSTTTPPVTPTPVVITPKPPVPPTTTTDNQIKLSDYQLKNLKYPDNTINGDLTQISLGGRAPTNKKQDVSYNITRGDLDGDNDEDAVVTITIKEIQEIAGEIPILVTTESSLAHPVINNNGTPSLLPFLDIHNQTNESPNVITNTSISNGIINVSVSPQLYMPTTLQYKISTNKATFIGIKGSPNTNPPPNTDPNSIIKSEMHGLRVAAEINYFDNNNYIGFCNNTEAKKHQANILVQNPNAYYVCKDNLDGRGQDYGVQANLLPVAGGTPETWCVDSTGFNQPGKIGVDGCVK